MGDTLKGFGLLGAQMDDAMISEGKQGTHSASA